MSLQRWSSCLERRRALLWAQHASSLVLDVLDFESSSSSSDSSSSFESDSSSDDDCMLVDSIEEALLVATTILDDMEMDIEDKEIRWRSKRDGGVTIDNLTDNDAISHFRFRKPHLQEVADKLWSRLH